MTVLPRIDEHTITVDAPAHAAWPAVIAVFAGITTRPLWRAYARAIRADPDRSSGPLDRAGATVPGFAVTRCTAPSEWVLEGRHLFSHYQLAFRIVPIDDEHCALRAESSAAFPGLHGTAYRTVVIGSGGHVIGVRSILRRIRARAERSQSDAPRS